MKLLRFILSTLLAIGLLVGPVAAKGGKGSSHSSGSRSSSTKAKGSDVHVKGYYRKDGTYVQPHMRSAPNGTKNDNFSTRGNVNPYTGRPGTEPRDEDYATTGTAGQRMSGVPEQYVPQAGDSDSQRALLGTNLVRPGMSKAQVLSEMGEPNIKTSNRWLYVGKGVVEFTASGRTK